VGGVVLVVLSGVTLWSWRTHLKGWVETLKKGKCGGSKALDLDTVYEQAAEQEAEHDEQQEEEQEEEDQLP